jgi:hypothetical protein
MSVVPSRSTKTQVELSSTQSRRPAHLVQLLDTRTVFELAVTAALVLLVLGTISATSEPAVAHDDTYLLCKGSIVTYLVNGQAPSRDEELAVHIESDKVNISGTSISGTDMQICMQALDKISFYSRPCTEVSEASVTRTYGTLNKITGNLVVTVTPSRSFDMLQGKFVCRKTEAIMK